MARAIAKKATNKKSAAKKKELKRRVTPPKAKAEKKAVNPKRKASNPHIGSSFDDLLSETGQLAEVNAIAIKRVIAWEVKQKMEEGQITKTDMADMADMMNTSRSALDRLLDPENTSITLSTLDNAARAIGKTLNIELR